MSVIANRAVRLVTVHLPDHDCEGLARAELLMMAQAQTRGYLELVAKRRPHATEVPGRTGFVSRYLVADEHAEAFLADVRDLCARFPVAAAAPTGLIAVA